MGEPLFWLVKGEERYPVGVHDDTLGVPMWAPRPTMTLSLWGPRHERIVFPNGAEARPAVMPTTTDEAAALIRALALPVGGYEVRETLEVEPHVVPSEVTDPGYGVPDSDAEKAVALLRSYGWPYAYVSKWGVNYSKDYDGDLAIDERYVRAPHGVLAPNWRRVERGGRTMVQCVRDVILPAARAGKWPGFVDPADTDWAEALTVILLELPFATIVRDGAGMPSILDCLGGVRVLWLDPDSKLFMAAGGALGADTAVEAAHRYEATRRVPTVAALMARIGRDRAAKPSDTRGRDGVEAMAQVVGAQVQRLLAQDREMHDAIRSAGDAAKQEVAALTARMDALEAALAPTARDLAEHAGLAAAPATLGTSRRPTVEVVPDSNGEFTVLLTGANGDQAWPLVSGAPSITISPYYSDRNRWRNRTHADVLANYWREFFGLTK